MTEKAIKTERQAGVLAVRHITRQTTTKNRRDTRAGYLTRSRQAETGRQTYRQIQITSKDEKHQCRDDSGLRI